MFKGFVRDKMSVFFAILFPMFFIVIFGIVFAGGGTSKQKVIEVGSVPLIQELPQQARDGLAQVVEFESGQTLDAALESVRKGDVAAAVEQQGDTLVVHYSNADQTAAATVQGVFSALIDNANLAAAGVTTPQFTLQPQQVEDQSLKTMQYVAPQMIAYGVSIGAVFGAALTLITWREKKLLRRLRLAPVSTSTVVGSRVAVSLGVALLQLVIFVGFSMLLGLKLVGAWYMTIPLVLAGTLSFLAIGLLVGAVAKTAEGGSGLANLITLPMAFLSGAFIPVEVAPQWMQVVSKFLPLGYLVDGMKDVMVRGQGPSAALIPILVLLAFAAVITVIATRLFKWDSA
ncbi:ABC transporter permease [Nakamurella sp. YIM 132087]|uniref:Transport permease protein n=2 Tax=Nakamurella alba TaxID=2665158 RepID=A0A7K1FRD4_9ACTN|nr:ABC transporter permease [Nakamurella alba]